MMPKNSPSRPVTSGEKRRGGQRKKNNHTELLLPSTTEQRDLSFLIEQKEQRIGWHDYFMSVAHLISRRSTCERAHIGAVIVRENNILSTGYNGSPAGLPHCDGPNCLIYKSTHPNGTVEENCMRTIHAEINAIAQAAKNGTSIKGADIYITASPCMNCLKVLINVGVNTIFYDKPYKLETIEELIRMSGVKLIQVRPGHR